MAEVRPKDPKRKLLGLEIATIAFFYFLEYLRVIGIAYVVNQPYAPGQSTSLFKDFDDSNVYMFEVVVILGSVLLSGIPVYFANKLKHNILALPFITILNLPIFIKGCLYFKLSRGEVIDYIGAGVVTMIQILVIEVWSLVLIFQE